MKKVLFFTYDFPYPTNTGGKNRSYYLLKYANSNIEVTLFSFIRDDFDPNNIEKLNEIGIKDIKFFKRKRLKDIRNIKSVLPTSSIFKTLYFDREIHKELLDVVVSKKIDIVHFESFYTSFYINKEFKKYGVKQIFGTENIEHLIYKDYTKNLAFLPLKPIYYLETLKIKREEENILKKADETIAVTENEAEVIKKLTDKKCSVIENGIDLSSFKFNPKKKGKTKNILFVGNFSYFPNLDAVKYFYSEVFKKINDENIKLTIVGKFSCKLSFIKDKRVEILEFVDDIKECYYKADVFVFPVRIGGGTNFKVLEAMALGVPVIAFPERVEGLQAKDNIHLLTASDVDSFKAQLERLLNDEELSLKLITNAGKLVEEKFSWEVIGKKLNKIWTS